MAPTVYAEASTSILKGHSRSGYAKIGAVVIETDKGDVPIQKEKPS
jgi:hypothetical protein